jgi:hypothetical protein
MTTPLAKMQAACRLLHALQCHAIRDEQHVLINANWVGPVSAIIVVWKSLNRQPLSHVSLIGFESPLCCQSSSQWT